LPGIRRPRKRALALTIPLVLGTALATGGVATAQAKPQIKVANGVTQPVFSYADAIREHVYVESPLDSDGDGRSDRVNVDIIRPKESGNGLKVPVIMDESPYYDNAGRGNESERKRYDANGNPVKFPLFYDNYFVPRGYAFLAVDMIGTTKSDGCPTSGGAPDVLGGKAVIDWLNGRAKAYKPDGTPATAGWTTGRVGMIGKSYDGTLANGVAATGVKGLETIVPISAISGWYDYSRMNGVKYWTDEQPGLADYVDTDPPAKCAAAQARMDAGEDDATGNYNAYWDETNYREGSVGQARNVRASVFAIHGINDYNVKPNHFSLWWNELARRGVPRKVWISQTGHVDPFDFRREAWVPTLHKWFDRWLQGIDNDVMRRPRADVETAPDQWATHTDWPDPHAVPVPLRPGAGGTLGLKPGAGGTTASFTDNPAQTESDMISSPGTPRADRLVFTSAPVDRAVRLSGTPVVDLRAKLDKPDANLTAMLVDYGQDTRRDFHNSGEGIRTLTEEGCYGASTADDDACYKKTAAKTITAPAEIIARGWLDAQNRRSLTTPQTLTPGTYYRFTWKTMPAEYVLKPGHRLALVLASSDASATEEAGTGATVTVDLAGSRVTVPAVATFGFGPQTLRTCQGPAHVQVPTPPKRFR
jgi:X-Pro dipeptidyl-peptidase